MLKAKLANTPEVSDEEVDTHNSSVATKSARKSQILSIDTLKGYKTPQPEQVAFFKRILGKLCREETKPMGEREARFTLGHVLVGPWT